MNNNTNLNDYSALEVGDVLKQVNSKEKGLSEQEAQKRLDIFGLNMISEKEELGVVFEFLSHFKSPLVIVLFVVTILSAYFGETTNAIIVGAMILFSVTLDFFEEHSAGKAAEKLKESVKTMAMVVRDSKEREVMASHICYGDILLLNAGDSIPADARIISANDFFVNQSALTGESFPVEKIADKLKIEHRPITTLDNIVFLGTNVVSGSAKAVVLKTGQETEFGHVAARLVQASPKSEFEIGVTRFGYFIMKVILVLVLCIFFFNSLIKQNILESFMFAIAVTVGITPELLPMIMSITMARGSIKMSKKGVIVKRLAAIPNFGGMNVLCTDKTGTLTEDKIAVITYTNIEGQVSEDVLKKGYLNSYFQSGISNSLNNALINFKKIDIKSYEKVDEIPFDFFRKIMSVIAEGPEGRQLIAKGAPEEIFKRCVLSKEAHGKALVHYHDLSAQGYRVLAVAVKKMEDSRQKYSKEDESNLQLLGFVSFLDPAKKDVKEILKELHQMGIKVKVITGDNELVAKKIGEEVGLDANNIILGCDIGKLTDDALRVRVENTTIFARFSPDEKNRVIQALRANGNVVGYLGDGINDAPSLKTADIGISVSNAVDVAKESADIVLTRKSLRVLRDGILEGRKAFGNTMKYIMMGLSSNFGNMFSVLFAVFYLPFLPMLPIQILLNNFLYDFSQITIPTDNVDREWIQYPRRWNLNFVKKFMCVFGPISSIFDLLTYFVLFGIFHVSAPVFQAGWFMESLATQVLVVHIIRTNKLPFFQSSASKLLTISTLLCVAIGWLIPFTFVGKIFNFEPVPFKIMLIIIGIVLAYLLLTELVKRIFYRWNKDVNA